MNPILRNILALIVGIVIGGIINGGIITLGASILPPPQGVDPNDIKSIRANMDLYEFKHFIIPYLAHLMGSFTAAFIAVRISNNKAISILAGTFFIIGGITMFIMVPESPIWFIVLDLISYIPAAYLGYHLGKR